MKLLRSVKTSALSSIKELCSKFHHRDDSQNSSEGMDPTSLVHEVNGKYHLLPPFVVILCSLFILIYHCYFLKKKIDAVLLILPVFSFFTAWHLKLLSA